MKKPKILFIYSACPFGNIGGSGVRILHIGRLLQRMGEVTMVGVHRDEWTPEQIRRVREEFHLDSFIRFQASPSNGFKAQFQKTFDPRWMNTNGVIVPPAESKRIEKLMSENDLVWIHTLKVANAFRRYQWPVSVLDVDDVPSKFHRAAVSSASTIRKKLWRWQNAFAWKRRETKLLERFSALVVCKEKDRSYLGNNDRVHVVPNGFEAPADQPPRRLVLKAPRLGMIGDFRFLPNADGLKWFLANAWDGIRKAVPSVELRLMGKGSQEIPQIFSENGVTGLGYVDDAGAEIATWSAMIVPTRLGGGTHLKVAEGLGRRVPIVTTAHGARGYQIQNDVHARIADSSETFAAACVTLLKNPSEGERLSAAGWEVFRRLYSWDAIEAPVRAAVADSLSRSEDGRNSGMVAQN